MAKILKAGDVVVLALRNTPDQLAKRILDFSFGVSSALDARVEAVAARRQISEVLDKMPHEMSGGQRQRVACARAIVCDPALVLADEPTGALDSRNSRKLLECLTQMNEAGATIIMVTHDSFAASYAHRALFIKDGRLFNELSRGVAPRGRFFDQIIDVVSFLGGEDGDAA